MIEVDSNIGSKFNADGTVRFFPGNTIISFVDHSAPIWRHFQVIRGMLSDCSIAHCITFLPDSSIHMTVFEGVCHQWRAPHAWTTKLPIDCTLEATDDLFEQAFKEVTPLERVQMRVHQVQVTRHGVIIHLLPLTESDGNELKRFRDECSRALGIRFPNHDTYEYHLSVGYFTKQPTLDEIAALEKRIQDADAYINTNGIVFTIAPPQLTFFDNMFQFNPYRIPRNGL